MFRFLLVLATVLGLAGAVSRQVDRTPQYDIVIRDGRVLDGAGNPWILANGLAENKLRMGVTTAIGGEGGTAVPVDSIDGYFRRLEEQGISINFGTYFSETQARVSVFGNASHAPREQELDEMRIIMARAMRWVVLGMTTALIYPPSSFASTGELVALASVAADYGGIYASHIRDEGAGLVTAVREAIEIGERAGLPVEIFQYRGAYEPGWGTIIKEAADVTSSLKCNTAYSLSSS